MGKREEGEEELSPSMMSLALFGRPRPAMTRRMGLQ